MGGKVNAGLNGTLEVKHKDILPVCIFKAFRLKTRNLTDSIETCLYYRNLRQNYVPIRQKAASLKYFPQFPCGNILSRHTHLS